MSASKITGIRLSSVHINAKSGTTNCEYELIDDKGVSYGAGTWPSLTSKEVHDAILVLVKSAINELLPVLFEDVSPATAEELTIDLRKKTDLRRKAEEITGEDIFAHFEESELDAG
ncbi:hypothetical protein LCGC14_0147230 [marine sediment metagenome]|uniref:Uncharacterized protein n=1 Tax=marine sediment metagenome TaxID=412755 RepID=A0A0F9XHM9_9ZZZZ